MTVCIDDKHGDELPGDKFYFTGRISAAFGQSVDQPEQIACPSALASYIKQDQGKGGMGRADPAEVRCFSAEQPDKGARELHGIVFYLNDLAGFIKNSRVTFDQGQQIFFRLVGRGPLSVANIVCISFVPVFCYWIGGCIHFAGPFFLEGFFLLFAEPDDGSRLTGTGGFTQDRA